MLTVVPKSWCSWDFTVMERDQSVAKVDVSWWREKGALNIQGVEHLVYREEMMGGDFILDRGGSVLARAQKPSAFHRSFLIAHEDRRYTLRAMSAFRRTFLLLDGDREVGSLSPEGVFTRRATADLPESLPLAVRVFIIWLVVIMWKRESNSGVAVAAATGG